MPSRSLPNSDFPYAGLRREFHLMQSTRVGASEIHEDASTKSLDGQAATTRNWKICKMEKGQEISPRGGASSQGFKPGLGVHVHG